MPTLYVENVPEDLYDALRQRARVSQRSVSAEVISLLRSNVPTAEEIARRQAILKRILRIQGRRPANSKNRFPNAAEMQCKDRLR